jgi:hypothetical protein
MTKGLSVIPKPFIKKVTIEKAQNQFINKGDYGADVGLYVDLPKDQAVKLSFEIGVMFQHPLDLDASGPIGSAIAQAAFYQSNIKNILSHLMLVGKEFTTKDSFEQFLTSTSLEKSAIMMATSERPVSLLYDSRAKWDDYLFKDDDGHSYGEIPSRFTTYYPFASQTNNPSFLAYAFALVSENMVLYDGITSEIIFDGGAIPKKTGYFTIADEIQFKGNIGPWTINVEQAFGAIGDVWVGPYHFQPTGDGSGAHRAMTGADHSPDTAHPYLDFNIVKNTKIIDTRTVEKIEKLFKYNSPEFQKMLATASDLTPPVFTGGKEKNTIDEMVPNKGIVSEACFSLIPQKINNVTNLFFAIDKMKLLKETTQLPGLLDRLIMANPSFGNVLVRNLNIFHFEISKTNIQTGVKYDLLTGNNDKSFNDLGATNYLKNNISKGYIFKQKTKDVIIKNKRNIALYEFTEGSIDKYDLGTYFYEIKLKFRDPLIQYLAMRLTQLRKVIKDLDELQTKTTLKMYDSSGNRGRFVNVFDKHQNKLNAKFVKEALKPPTSPPPQIAITFPFVEELPNSLWRAFPATESENFLAMDNLNALLLGLNSYDGLEPVLEFATEFGTAKQKLEDVVAYIRNSLVLSSTSPSRIGRIRSLLFLLESRITDSLKLYTTEKITKQDVGFTSADYEKSQGNTNNTTEYVIEYAHRFNKQLDLSKAVNSFDWISNVGPDTNSTTIKTITKGDYINAVKSSATNILTDKGKATFTADTNFSYSFLPFSVFGDNLNLRNRIKAGWVTDPYWEIQKIEHLQTIRKELTDRITGTPQSVVTPEILAQFGVRFTTQLEELRSSKLWFDGLSIPSKQINNPDNWGEPFDPLPPNLSADLKDQGVGDKKQNKKFNNSFGSAENPLYEWAGDSKEHYPKALAGSLVNLIFSDNIQHFRDLNFFNQPESNPFKDFNKEIPYMINLFSHPLIATNIKNAKDYISENVLESLFEDVTGQLIINNYALYVALLGLFGKVYYLDGFKQGFADAKLTPSSFVDRNMVKAMNWIPMTKGALDKITPRRSLFCKVELFENSGALDEQIINLFQKYFNYNQYFYISAGASATQLPTIIAPAQKLLDQLAAPTGSRVLSPTDFKIMKIGPLTKALSNNFFIKVADDTKLNRPKLIEPEPRDSGPTSGSKRKGPTKRR